MSNFRVKLSLFINYFVFAILLNSVGAVILQMQKNFNISKGSVAFLEAFKDMSIAITSFIIASYVLRIGYKRAMLLALALVSVMCFIMPSTGSFVMIKILFATVGVSFALIKVSVFSTLALVTSTKKEHLSLMNFLESFFMVGIVSGSFLFGYFVDDNNPKSLAWLQVYYILGGLSTLAFILLFSTRIDETPVREVEMKKTAGLGFLESLRLMIKDFVEMLRLALLPLVLVFIFCAFFYVLIEQSIMSWLPTFNNDVVKLSPSLSIQMASILSGSFALGRFLAGIVLRKLDWLYVLVVCLLISAALVIVIVPLANNISGKAITSFWDIPVVAFAFPVIGIFLAPIYPAINSVILSNIPANKHGAMSGLIVVFSALGGSTGSIITGNIFDAYGGQTAFYVSLIPVSVLICLLFIFKKLQPKGGKIDEASITVGGH